ncbi:zinc finger protein with KRAB and SCAN domains 3 [Strongylocentrotus purpuratus]|uniref:C2H2-type domain-containing protein n=1 Tax=Strongylocentrotus purpuratus TaxID=7668 RepID=A0A7M7NCL2_STRPU|nr:zinc finger protein with KRAB and SCAN domains 3 [Strongylocentrotus purpuratus]
MSAGKKKGRQSWTSEDWDAEFKAASQKLAQDLGLDQPKQKRKKDSVWVYNRPDPETGLIKKRSKERKRKAPKKKGESKARLQVPQRETLHDKIKEEKMDSAMDNGLCFKPPMAVKICKQEVVIKIEKDDYVDGDSQCPTLQSGQEGSLMIDKEEKVVFQRSDGFKIYFIKQELKEEVCQQETGPCSKGDMALEQSSLQQWTLEAQPKEKTFVGDTKQDSVEEAEGVQAASQVSSGGCRNVIKESRHVLLDTKQDSVEEEGVGLQATSRVSSGGCRNVFEESRQRNSEHGRSKHAKLPSNVGMGHIKAEEITESEDGSEANVALSSKADKAIVKVEAPVPRTYACPTCSQRFSKRYHLKEHKYRIHSGESPYECPQCRKGFVRLRDLEYHFKIRHRSIYKTTCECGDILTDKQLDGHKRTCRGKKLNQCAQCLFDHVPRFGRSHIDCVEKAA